jgi:hypothetical protein
MEAGAAYPVTLAVDYPERQSRWKTLLRLFLAIPVRIFALFVFVAQGALAGAIWIAIIVCGRIPGWIFDSQVALTRWQVRALSYCLLLTDTYPPFEGDYPIRFEAQYPERLSRRKVLIWKYFTVLPHSVVLFFLWIAAYVALIIAWFAILFTGRFPRGLHGYVAGVIRWGTRVQAYFLSLTDEYPPFSLSAEAGPAGRDTYLVSSVIGWLLGAGMVALFVAAFFLGRETVRVTVSYNDLTAGHVSSEETKVDVRNMDISLISAMDPADEAFNLVLGAGQNKHLVAFRLRLSNNARISRTVRESDFELKDSDGKWHDPELAVASGRVMPVKFKKSAIQATVIFEIGDDARPAQLKYQPFGEGKRVIYEFE